MRLVGSRAGLLFRHQQFGCQQIEVPWLAHAHSVDTLVGKIAPAALIAYAGSWNGHHFACKLGFDRWRYLIRNACSTLNRPGLSPLSKYSKGNVSACALQLPRQANSPSVASSIRLYAQSTFCLQPPGDMLSRPGINC